MAKVSIVSGLLLIILGLYSYFGISSESITALIPAFIGLPVFILGIVALNEKYLKHTMHVNAILMVIGLIGGVVMASIRLSQGKFGPSVIAMLILAAICLIFTILAVRSFIEARKAREKAAGVK